MSPYEELRVLLALVGEGQQGEKQTCPFCGGGREREKSLDIVRFEGNSGAYQCKRANCGKEGYIGKRYGTHYTPANRPPAFRPRNFSGTIEKVPDDIAKHYTDKYGWTEREFAESGCGWSPEYNRSVWKICSPTGAIRGFELRSHRDEDRPKTLHYRHSADAWVGYYGLGERQGLVVAVEDCLSAYKVGRVYPAASIMGSHLTFDMLVDLMKVSENIVLCLDRDATTKAEKFAKRFAFICPNLIHVPLQRDLKYEREEAIKEILTF